MESDGTFALKRRFPSVARESWEIVGGSVVSGLASVTPGTLPTAVTMPATDVELAESVIFPDGTVNRIWPVAPLWPKRSATTSCPCCDWVPGIENESS